MFFLSKAFDSIPSMNWKFVWEGVFLRFGRALNSVSRDSIKRLSVQRTHIAKDVVIHVNGKRWESDYWSAPSATNSFLVFRTVGDDPLNPAFHVHNLHIANVSLPNPDTAPTNSFSEILISYKIDISDGPAHDVNWNKVLLSARPSIDGLRMPVLDCVTMLKFNTHFAANGVFLRKMSLCGCGVVKIPNIIGEDGVPAGIHSFNVDIMVPDTFYIYNVEVNMTRFNW